MMGRLGLQEREYFADLVTELIHRDEKRIAHVLLKLTDFDDEPDKNLIERDLAEFADQHLYVPLKEMKIGRLLQRLLEILTRHHLRLKPDFFLIIKALSTIEILGRALDARFMLMTHAEPFVRSLHLNRLNPKRIAGDMIDSGTELLSLLSEIPGELRSILRQAREGRVKIEFEHRGLDPLLFTHDRTSNRIAFAIVLASLIIGSSLIVLSGVPPKWNEIPLIGLVGFVVAGVMGFWLLISILRRGKM
jgi:ubiquinone biosynthesis protein